MAGTLDRPALLQPAAELAQVENKNLDQSMIQLRPFDDRYWWMRAFRAVPDRVDEKIAVPLPKKCPDCGGQVVRDSTEPQFQEDIVRQTIVSVPNFGEWIEEQEIDRHYA